MRTICREFASFKLDLAWWDALGTVDLLIRAREIQDILIANVKRVTVLSGFLNGILIVCQLKISPRDTEYQRAFNLDLIALWSYILLILSNDRESHDLLSRNNRDAQLLIDLFQSLLNCSDIGGQSRDVIVKALIFLSQRTGLYPESIKHATVDKVLKIPCISSIAWVFEAEIGIEAYAIKVFRQPQVVNPEQRLRMEEVRV
jgi:hypothetical protein